MMNISGEAAPHSLKFVFFVVKKILLVMDRC